MLSLFLAALAFAGPVEWCADFEATEPSLYYSLGVVPSSLPSMTDPDVIDTLVSNPNDRVARQIAIARTRIWTTLSYKLDATGSLASGGTWHFGPVTDPTSGFTFDAVHWSDIDDDSWTLYFVGLNVCAVVYEN